MTEQENGSGAALADGPVIQRLKWVPSPDDALEGRGLLLNVQAASEQFKVRVDVARSIGPEVQKHTRMDPLDWLYENGVEIVRLAACRFMHISEPDEYGLRRLSLNSANFHEYFSCIPRPANEF